MLDIHNKINQQFNEWTITAELGNGKVKCRCSCGTIRTCIKYNIVSGCSKSCGCLALEQKKKIRKSVAGHVFNEWTIIKELGNKKVLARCSCGIEKECAKTMIVTGRSKSCGHSTNKKKILDNQTFSEWTIIKELDYGWAECRCSCGTMKIIKRAIVTGGYTKSCGCKRIEKMQDTLMQRYGETTANKIDKPREKWQIKVIESKESFENFIEINFKEKPTIKELVSVFGVNESYIGRLVKKYDSYDIINFQPITSQGEKDLRNFISNISQFC